MKLKTFSCFAMFWGNYYMSELKFMTMSAVLTLLMYMFAKFH